MLAVLGAAVALAACGVPSNAGGEFKPAHAGTLTVATSELPVVGFWEGPPSAPTGGFEQALAAELAKRFGLRSVHVIQRPFTSLVKGDLGGADIGLAEITPTDARENHLDFSTPYLSSPPGALMRAGQDMDDIKSAREDDWAVERGTTLQDDLSDQVDPDTKPLVTSTQNEAIDAVATGKVDAALLDLPVALALQNGSPKRFKVAAKFDSDAVLAAALPEGSGNVDAISSDIRKLIDDGTLNDLAKRWLGADLEGIEENDVPLLVSRLK